ncbi:MAG: rcc01693 family protein [Pararhodobacter sp.]
MRGARGAVFDWPGLMRAGLHGLGLRPAEFWALTPVELMVMLGREPAAGRFTRARLEHLLRRFPDRAAPIEAATGPAAEGRPGDRHKGEEHGDTG